MATTAERFDSKLPQGATTDELKEQFKGKNVLFYIERSLNSNAVVYEANVVDGKLDAKNPVKVYWILYARDPVKEEGLNMVERNSAYGSKCVPDPTSGDGHYIMTLSAIPKKKIRVSMSETGQLHAKTEISGNDQEIIKMFVDSTTSWGMPKVNHVDVTGRDESGNVVEERIVPK